MGRPGPKKGNLTGRTGSATWSTGFMREGVVRTPQERLRRAPRRSKNLSRQRPVSVTSCPGPKNAPRWLQYVSRWHRDGSKTLQDAPKRGPEGPWDDPRTCHGNGRFPRQVLRAPRTPQDGSEALLGPSWAPLAALLQLSWEHIGALLGLSRPGLGISWAIIKPSWAVLRPCWGHIGPSLGDLESTRSRIGPILAQKAGNQKIIGKLK